MELEVELCKHQKWIGGGVDIRIGLGIDGVGDGIDVAMEVELKFLRFDLELEVELI